MPADIKALSLKHADRADRVAHGRAEEEKMRVRMLVTRTGSPDGIRAERYEAGKIYDLPLSLAQPYLSRGYAEQDKLVEAAPEQMAAPVPGIALKRKKR